MTQEEIEQLVLDTVTMIEDPNGKCIRSYSYEDLAEDIAQRLVKKLTIPAVVGRSEQFKCEKCNSNWVEVRATCFECGHESEDLST